MQLNNGHLTAGEEENLVACQSTTQQSQFGTESLESS